MHTARVVRIGSSNPAGLPEDDLLARGADPALRPLVRALAPAARGGGPVLFVGESGVGKEYFARHVHRLRWGDSGKFVSLLAAGVTDERLGRLLRDADFDSDAGFGSDRADRAERALSLYLRSVELLAPSVQLRLLVWLRSARRGTRRSPLVMAGTQRDLKALAARGEFERSLAERLLATRPLLVPPLRDRREDRLFVAMEVLAKIARDAGRPIPRLSAWSWDRILRGRWPGNVRELETALRESAMESEARPTRPPATLGVHGSRRAAHRRSRQ
jgi:DNA-binding NtrC family response regulator